MSCHATDISSSDSHSPSHFPSIIIYTLESPLNEKSKVGAKCEIFSVVESVDIDEEM